MKKHILLTFLLFSFFSCINEQKEFTINANIKGVKDSTKVTLYNLNTYKVMDTTLILDHKFKFKGKLDYPVEVGINIYDINILFWLENNKITINSSKEKLLEASTEYTEDVKGSETNKIALSYKELISPIKKRQGKAYKKLKENAISEEKFQKYLDSIERISYQFFVENPNNYFSLASILTFKNNLEKDKLKKYYNLLSNKYKNTSYGKNLNSFINIKPLEKGDLFFDIIGENLKGETIKLSDFKGKVILLEFWAGWCPPCIVQMKDELPRLQEKYKNNNFQIVSFSFDFDKTMWKNASKKLNIEWPDYSNLTKIDINPVSLKYGIKEIPVSFIIGVDGKIIKRMEYNDDLEKKLDKVLLQK
jgi:thiol-disulfide isomerase/thioredoxin